MEANEQELRRYLIKRLNDYCYGEMCGDCDIREKSELPTSKLLELYFAAYPDMKPTPEITDQVIDYLKKEMKRQLVGEAETKTDEQTAKADAGKAPIGLVPMEIVWAIAWIRKYGNEKYGDPDNWKNVEPERYRDALMRHILHYISVPKSVDEESRYPHLWHAACNMAFLINMEYGDMCHYDFAVEKPEWEKIGKEAVENIISSPKDDGEIRCKNCLYFDEDEDGEHCSECKRNYCDMFVRKDK